ncbi:hypothetical protein E2562_015644 [Oryza meyeriana var. granulata]|uniref:Uncharacterized protein n=1 Tax=Oryza meyeriana var. granulata TaxID=110450 RepID=A0A6G1EJJ6_9ORYZ|nr:hypothetical protein E2562_015644 [Oryza meyeriana var. granulata]
MAGLKAFPAAAMPCRRDMKRRLQEELDTVYGLLSKAEALVAVAVKDVNGSAAAAAEEARSRRQVAQPEPPKIEAVDAPSLCHLEDGEIAPAVGASSLCQLEEGEITGDQGADMDIDMSGGIPLLVVDKVQFSPLAKKDDAELVDISGDTSLVAIEKFSEAYRSSSDSYSCDDDGVASPATQKSELIAMAQEKKRLRHELERKRAREALEELESTARPISDAIDPMDMELLGLYAVQYIVSPSKSPESLRRRGGLLQQLGFFLKAEYS